MSVHDLRCAYPIQHSVDFNGHPDLEAPSRWLWFTEGRAFFELAFSTLATPLLMTAKRGDGHAVLVFPGFLADDVSTMPMRTFLAALGYDVYDWDLGRNLGGVARIRKGLLRKLEEITQRVGGPVSLVGWSLGGIYARMLALDMPESVRSVITLGSPSSRIPHASNVRGIYDAVSGSGRSLEERLGRRLFANAFDRIGGDLMQPVTSLYTRLDGIVDWRACLVRAGARAENIEIVGASHAGLGVNAAALWAVADRLAQPDGIFTTFAPGGPFGFCYGNVE